MILKMVVVVKILKVSLYMKITNWDTFLSLFLLYINDLHIAIRYSKIYHFTDDTNLLNINLSPKQMQKHVNIDLKLLYKWLLANKILNSTKTEVIFFHKTGHPINGYNFNIKINGHKIKPSEYIKYLGIYIDSTLSGKHH